ncbi:MAG: hypothetical protein AAFX65_04000 [Cyanobacteria bacterium J06638_7]
MLAAVPPVFAPFGARALLALLLVLTTAPARAGSITASSIISEASATQRAIDQLPEGATVVSSRCQAIGIRGGSYSYRCTVRYSTEPEREPSGP